MGIDCEVVILFVVEVRFVVVVVVLVVVFRVVVVFFVVVVFIVVVGVETDFLVFEKLFPSRSKSKRRLTPT